jgi:hypothetical protein
MDPCWAVLAVLDRPLFEDWDASFINQGPLSWVCRQAAKPGRPKAEAWVLHTSPDGARVRLEQNGDAVKAELLEVAQSLPGAQSVRPVFLDAHRWRYALARAPLEAGALWAENCQLALAGDWCAGSRVEGAFLSGTAAAGRVMALAAAKSERP